MAPHPDTVVRVLGAQHVAQHAGAYLARRAHSGPVTFTVAGPGWLPALAVDGKAVRGAAGPDGLIPYLLAAATHGTGAVLAERMTGPKTNEVPEFAPLLRDLNECHPLAGHVITADAGHTVRAHARLICEELVAHYVFTVKKNTRKLWDALDGLDWTSVSVQHATEERRHGRRELRTHQVMDAPPQIRQLFPHASQAGLAERYVTRIARVKKGKRWAGKIVRSAIAVFIITSLSAREAAPEHLAGYVRGTGRSRTRSTGSVRDVTFREDHSRVRIGSKPRNIWPPSVTSRSGSSARPAITRSPRPSAASNMTPPCSWPSSASRTPHDQHKLLCGTPCRPRGPGIADRCAAPAGPAPRLPTTFSTTFQLRSDNFVV